MIRMLYLVFVMSILNVQGALLPVSSALAQGISQPDSTAKTILFFGNSLTAGYGLDPALAFPALIQEKLKARGWDFRVVNAGVSGDTTASGLRRLDWVLQRPIAVLVLELGANDGLRGLPLAAARQNLQAIIDRTRQKYPQVQIVLAGMHMPTNLGPEYTSTFRAMFRELAAANQAAFIPFLLDGVGGIPSLNLPDGIHPNPSGHKIIAENVWQVLMPVLQSIRQP
jgi:acyl-CoA thioesterase I